MPGPIVKIAPSLLSADFSHLGQEIEDLSDAGADLLHLDVMDGHFVPNLTLGPAVIKSLRSKSSLPFDVHLMVTNPEKFITPFIEAGADFLTVHQEVPSALQALEMIKNSGKKAGLSIRPDTPVAVLEPYLKMIDLVLIMTVYPGFGGQPLMHDQIHKIEWVARKKKELNLFFEISVDGGVDPTNAHTLIEKGASILVAGTAIFKNKNYQRTIDRLRRAVL